MSTTPPLPQDEVANSAEVVSSPPTGNRDPRSRRLLALGLVLFVSFGHFIVASAYSLMGGTVPGDFRLHQARLLGALTSEAGSLAVLWYVLSGQGRTWKDIGWNLKWMDVPRAAGLVLASRIARYLVLVPFQVFYKSYFGHYLTPKPIHALLGFGISGLSIALVCLNPFFEESIVRGYLMSEISDLGGNAFLAVLTSIAVQMSYHLYQGLGNGIALTVGFAVYSIYFWKTRRIAPVVLAHFYADAYGLVRGSF
jgi:membrane protease YdiL (CAAX protease family)